MRSKKYIEIPRRRRQGKTDYRKRRGIIASKRNFLTVSISNKHIYGQIHRASAKGDYTICSASSSDLLDIGGWRGSPKNIPSAYLTGYLLGKRSLGKDLNSVVYYSGVASYIHGSRIASLVKGAKDAGLDILVDDESLPDESRTKGEHIMIYARKLESEDKKSFNHSFSKILASGFSPFDYASQFEQTRKAIESRVATAS